MCATCGCGDHHEGGGHPHVHEHAHAHGPGARTIKLEREILEKNAAFARENRDWLARRRVAAINVMSAPGSGKTTLLESVLRTLAGRVVLSVLEGDQETERDAIRIREAGARAVQINTGKGCHLDAHDVGHALEALDPPARSVVIIENVGNLVCPALFDLGERTKVALLSVTEGDDKPLKYPNMFRAADVVVLTKVDLLPYVRFDAARALEWAREINPRLRVFALSATTGEGMEPFCAWLAAQAAEA